MCIITLMTVSTALPTIGAEMDIELSEAGWIVSPFFVWSFRFRVNSR
ncbi:MAG: hypothetical protein CM1200mP15_21730 [Dehalococcoidia bacterium]|nr:MAG: hypothetical protein CM1200mP15_21730 [Dehalococcoidia bacterium]